MGDVPWRYRIREQVGYTYTFDHDWEAATGIWKIQVWQSGKILASKEKVQVGTPITLTSQGRSVAMLVPPEKPKQPWRVAVPDDPKNYGDLQSPIMDDWS